MTLGERWDKLPPWAKGVTAVATVGVTVVVGWTAYDIIKRKIGTASDRAEKSAIKKQLANSPNPPTLSPAQIQAYVDQLKEALGGWVTDSSVVYNIFDAMKNDADVLSLEQAYGTQTINYPIGSFTGTLSATVAHDMPSSSIIQKSVADINQNLTKKGITIKF